MQDSIQDYGLVSIITPAWACGKFIGRTIRSIQSQTYTNWELLIQDDCSLDETKTIVEEMARDDSRIKYECNPQNSGAAIARNNALKRAKGKWMAFLDADDIWLPEKLERQLKFMTDNDYAFSYHEYTEISEEGNDLGVYVSGLKEVNKWQMYTCCWPGCLTVMYNKERIGLIQIKDVKRDNDSAMWFKVVQKSPCYLMKGNLAKYRRRQNSITPPTILDRILVHYTLFRVAEEMNPINAFIMMCMNVVGNSYKKLFFVKKSGTVGQSA